jgi:anoctamin-10/anoctamin-7
VPANRALFARSASSETPPPASQLFSSRADPHLLEDPDPAHDPEDDSSLARSFLGLTRSLCVRGDEVSEEPLFAAAYPLHDETHLYALRSQWLVWQALPQRQPFRAVRDYFGEKVALYFAWLGHYTLWLCLSAAVGLLVTWHMSVYADGNPDTILLPWFGIFMCLWSTFYVESWKRRSAQLAVEWGMVGFEKDEADLPRFRGTLISSPVDGLPMKFFPASAKLQRLCLAFLVTCTLVMGVVGVVAGIYYFRFWSTDGGGKGQLFFGLQGSTVASVANAIQIQVRTLQHTKQRTTASTFTPPPPPPLRS